MADEKVSFVDQATIMFSEPGWYLSNFGAYLLAAFLGGFFSFLFSLGRDRPYKGWRVILIEHAKTEDLPEAHKSLKLLPEEVRQLRGSDIEGFRIIRSLVSGYCTITTANLETAKESGWVTIEDKCTWWFFPGKGKVTVALPKLPIEQLKDKKWNDGCEPRGWRDSPKTKTPSKIMFVSGHKGAHEWAGRKGIKANQITHLTEDIIEQLGDGDTVIGTLPVNIISRIQKLGARYIHLSLELTPEAREKARTQDGLSADEMDIYGANLKLYSVSSQGEFLPG